jgi:hypothetical protein
VLLQCQIGVATTLGLPVNFCSLKAIIKAGITMAHSSCSTQSYSQVNIHHSRSNMTRRLIFILLAASKDNFPTLFIDIKLSLALSGNFYRNINPAP